MVSIGVAASPDQTPSQSRICRAPSDKASTRESRRTAARSRASKIAAAVP